MTIDRAIEILDPMHRECYDSIETVNEACRMGMQALEKQIKKKPKTQIYMGDEETVCPSCGNPYIANSYCDCCGQAIDWSDEK